MSTHSEIPCGEVVIRRTVRPFSRVGELSDQHFRLAPCPHRAQQALLTGYIHLGKPEGEMPPCRRASCQPGPAVRVWACLVHDPSEFSAHTSLSSTLGSITSHIPKTVQHGNPFGSK